MVIVANCFADYFANVAKGNTYMIYVRRITNITQASSLYTRKYNDVALDFNFHAIPEKDVSDVLENIIPRKSLCWDSPIVPILEHCIDEGSWPTKWKMEEWTPLFRKGDVLLIIFAWKRRVINF